MKVRTRCWMLPTALLWLSSGTESIADPTERSGEAPTVAPSAPDPSAIAPAVFPHDEHVEDLEIACTECHHETNAAPLSIPHADYFEDLWIDCQICHHDSDPAGQDPQRCSHCHLSPQGDIADETLSAKVVVHEKCWSCHDVGTGSEASATCHDCHPE